MRFGLPLSPRCSLLYLTASVFGFRSSILVLLPGLPLDFSLQVSHGGKHGGGVPEPAHYIIACCDRIRRKPHDAFWNARCNHYNHRALLRMWDCRHNHDGERQPVDFQINYDSRQYTFMDRPQYHNDTHVALSVVQVSFAHHCKPLCSKQRASGRVPCHSTICPTRMVDCIFSCCNGCNHGNSFHQPLDSQYVA